MRSGQSRDEAGGPLRGSQLLEASGCSPQPVLHAAACGLNPGVLYLHELFPGAGGVPARGYMHPGPLVPCQSVSWHEEEVAQALGQQA